MVTLQAADETETSVPVVSTIPTGSGPVGYILFNLHIATSEQELIDAVMQLKAAAVSTWCWTSATTAAVDIASELAYMVAGPVATAGATFQKQTFNTKYPSTNRPAGGALTPTPFHTTSRRASPPSGVNLPHRRCRAYSSVLTGPGTCSAQERGDRGQPPRRSTQVIQIGTTTCGKPYASPPAGQTAHHYLQHRVQRR